MTTLRIATRGSALALAQAQLAADALRAHDPELTCDVVEVRTEGDADRATPLRDLGGRGVFVRAVEDALIKGRADVAVHSLKDVPTEPVGGLVLGAMLRRGDARDALVASGNRRLADLPPGARVGTSSTRRAALLAAIRPDLTLAEIRGNVDTRIRKVEQGEYDAVVLAVAGLARLGRTAAATQYFDPLEFIPSPGQGAITVQCRGDDAATLARLHAIDDAATRAAVEAERGYLGALGSGCSLPVGAYATVDAGLVVLRAMLAPASGQVPLFGDATGPVEQAAELGAGLARQLLAAADAVTSSPPEARQP